FGQAAGGVLGDLLGWRNVFYVLAGLFALATAGLVFELAVNPQTRKSGARSQRGLLSGYAAVLTNPFARMVLIAGFLEGALAWGAFAYIGAHLRLRFGLSFSLIGGIVACFGIGGLIYAAFVKLFVTRLGQAGLAVTGGFILPSAYLPPRRRFSPTRARLTLVDRPDCNNGDRPRLLHAAQHAVGNGQRNARKPRASTGYRLWGASPGSAWGAADLRRYPAELPGDHAEAF